MKLTITSAERSLSAAETAKRRRRGRSGLSSQNVNIGDSRECPRPDSRLRVRGKSKVGEYFSRYAAGMIAGRPAMLVYDRELSLERPAYFVALEIEGEQRVTGIRDFVFARYVMDGAELQTL